MSHTDPEPPTIHVAITGEEMGSPDRAGPGPDEMVGGRYRLGTRIGIGGMGEVMAARDIQIARDVAVKRMRAAKPTPRAVQRFLREANVQGRLEHPAIVPVHEIGRDSDDLPYFVMKKLSGTPLSKILHEPATMGRQRVLRAFADACLAVEFAHVRGIVHRDLKPDNIILGEFGEVYVLDWGVAKILGEPDGDFADVGSGTGTGEPVTRRGTAIGTPGYMSPEQVRGESDIDGRSDVYALGCLLFEILTGEPLHPRGKVAMRATLDGVDARASARAPERDVPPELDELCMEATKVDRAARVQTARELAERVERFLDGDRDLALRRSLALDHLERARAAFAAGDDDDNRRTAMREAAAAIALDPGLGGAAELVGRLMLEPPRETPREVREAIALDHGRDVKVVAKAGIWAASGGLAYVPLVWWISPDRVPYALTLMACLLVNLIITVYVLRAASPRPGLMVIANAIVVVVVARIFSPILIAPGIAAALAIAMVMTPRFSILGSPLLISLVMVGAVTVPLWLEQVGVLSTTMSVSRDGVLFSAPAISGAQAGPTMLVGALYAIALIAGGVIAAYYLRSRTVESQKHLHLQTWQLRQLVPR